MSHKDLKLSIALGALVAVLCWRFFSPSLDDQDSALFVAAVDRFDLNEQRPHPPGYPIYILLGKLGVFFGMSAQAALALVSCVGAGISAALLPQFFTVLGFARKKALATSFAVLASPLFLMTSCKILTDSAGFAVFLALTIWLMARPKSAGFFFGIAAALGVGVRPHVLLPLLPLIFCSEHWRRRLVGCLCGILALAVGLILVQGAQSLAQAMEAQATMRFRTRGISVFSPGTDLTAVLERMLGFLKTFFRSTLGIRAGWIKFLGLLALTYGLFLFVRCKGRVEEKRTTRLLLGGVVLYAIFLFLFLPPHPRYYLPILPVAFAALTLCRVPLAIALGLALLPLTAYRVAKLNELRSPVHLAIEWMDRLDPDRQVPLVQHSLAAHVRLLAPERLSAKQLWNQDLPPPMGRFFTDRKDLIARAKEAKGDLVLLESRLFERPVEMHDKYYRLQIQLLERRR